MSSQRRSRRRGYAVGAALIAIGAALVITLVVVGLNQVARKAPTHENSFANGQTVRVHVDAGGSRTIYANTMYTNTGADASMKCSVYSVKPNPGPQDAVSVNRTHFNIPITQWRPEFSFTVRESGDYAVRCAGAPGDVRYAVGEYLTAGQFAYAFAGIGVGMALTVAGIATLIVTAARRTGPQPPPIQYPPPR